MRILFTLYISICCTLISNAQHENGLVNWIDLETMQEKFKDAPKPVLLDFYTDWCGWCKHMMKTTYSNPNIASYINQHFYAVKFNAETKDTVEFQGKTYKPLSPEPRTPHELAIKFLGERLSYPSTIFITNNFSYNLLVPGFLEDKKLEPILVFMVENAWQSAVFDDFSRHFNHSFYDTAYPKGKVRLLSVTEMQQQQKKKPKKVLVSFDAPFCNTCKVMNRTTFTDTSLADYINKNYYVVTVDITSTDTIVFKGEKHFPTVVNNFTFHSLGLRIAGNRFSIPALCVLDEELNTVDVLNYYQGPERLKPILKYFGDNIYRKKSFSDFMGDYNRRRDTTRAN